jgi:hypothetical protein
LQLKDLENGMGDVEDGEEECGSYVSYDYDDSGNDGGSFRAADPYQNHRGGAAPSPSPSGVSGMDYSADASGTPSKQLHPLKGGGLGKRRPPARSTNMVSEFAKFGVRGDHTVAKVRIVIYANYRETTDLIYPFFSNLDPPIFNFNPSSSSFSYLWNPSPRPLTVSIHGRWYLADFCAPTLYCGLVLCCI